MKNNKSIDGLVTRSAKLSAAQAASALHTKNTPTSRTVISRSKLAEAKEESLMAHHEQSIEDFLKPVTAFDFNEQSGELTEAKEPIKKMKDSKDNSDELKFKKTKKSKKSQKPTHKKRRIIISIIIAVLVIAGGFAAWFFIWGNDIIARITGGQGNLLDFLSETYEPLKADENGRTNILAFGTSGYNMEGDEGSGVHDGAQLTDSIMLISLDQNTGDVAMLSLPRDLKVSSTCTATGKINEVYWCNNTNGDNESAGASALMNEVGVILGVDIQYYAHINWGSLEEIVDALDGITVVLDEDIEDYYYTGAVYKAGQEYHLNGEEAVGLSRARHGTESGDFSRGASQQKILIGIKDKVLTKHFSIGELLNFASTLGDNLRTNFSVAEMKTFAHLSSSFDFNNMRQLSLIKPKMLVTTSEINGISYVVPSAGVGNYGAIQKYVSDMLSNDPRAYEDYSILVLNGSGESGVAGTEQLTLEEEKYQNIYTNDAPDGDYTEHYTLYALTDEAPGTKKLLEEKYQTTAKSKDELPAGISNLYDFVIIIGPETTANE